MATALFFVSPHKCFFDPPKKHQFWKRLETFFGGPFGARLTLMWAPGSYLGGPLGPHVWTGAFFWWPEQVFFRPPEKTLVLEPSPSLSKHLKTVLQPQEAARRPQGRPQCALGGSGPRILWGPWLFPRTLLETRCRPKCPLLGLCEVLGSLMDLPWALQRVPREH